MDHIHALQTGTRLQEYTVRKVLGVGGFGITRRWDRFVVASAGGNRPPSRAYLQ